MFNNGMHAFESFSYKIIIIHKKKCDLLDLLIEKHGSMDIVICFSFYNQDEWIRRDTISFCIRPLEWIILIHFRRKYIIRNSREILLDQMQNWRLKPNLVKCNIALFYHKFCSYQSELLEELIFLVLYFIEWIISWAKIVFLNIYPTN